jgi:hypothetical protein
MGVKMTKYKPVNFEKIQTYSISERQTKVDKSNFAKVCLDLDLNKFYSSLPKILKVNELFAIIDKVEYAINNKKPVIIGIGGHVIKCGLSPLLIYLMKHNIIDCLIMNGGASIHDFEVGLMGRTSEEVGESIDAGMFGMVMETGLFMNEAINEGAELGIGMGEILGTKLIEMNAVFVDLSVLAAGIDNDVSVTVHTGIGLDTIHMHPNADGSAIGKTSFIDFKILIAALQRIGDGGVYINIGSSVVLPEIFIKALNVARNLSDEPIVNFTTVNMDMKESYRPTVNVLQRPTKNNGCFYSLTGHHEIMVPLLFNGIIERL